MKIEAKKTWSMSALSVSAAIACMLTPFGSRPTLCFFSLLLMMQVEEALVALDISCSCCLVGL